jgi:hypothetical protein
VSSEILFQNITDGELAGDDKESYALFMTLPGRRWPAILERGPRNEVKDNDRTEGVSEWSTLTALCSAAFSKRLLP